MNLTVKTIGEICDEVGGIIRTGPFGSQLHEYDYVDDGVPVIMPKDIIDGRITDAGIARIGSHDAERLSQHSVKCGDIIYGRRGDIGRRALITEREVGWICGTGCLRISLDDSVIDPKFLFYYLGHPDITAWIANQAIGATLPNLNTAIIRNVPIRYPQLRVQKQIAGILANYDDLIENNTRRIAILEEMARSLYREWFVNFRFPGHQEVKMVDSPLGPIPEGWEIKPIGDVIETYGGGTPSTKQDDYWSEGTITWFSPTDLTKNNSMFISYSDKKITEKGLMQSSAKLFPAYSVMMTSRATIGVTAINTLPACTNQGFITCLPNKHLPVYQLYFWIEYNKRFIEGLASGSTFKEISRGTFRQIPIIMAKQTIIDKYHTIVTPICREIELLINANMNLKLTRDLLLPRLVSGEIDVSKLANATIVELP